MGIWQTVVNFITKLRITEMVRGIFTNDMVVDVKYSLDLYWNCVNPP